VLVRIELPRPRELLVRQLRVGQSKDYELAHVLLFGINQTTSTGSAHTRYGMDARASSIGQLAMLAINELDGPPLANRLA